MPMTLEQFGLDKLSDGEKRQVLALLDESLAAEADDFPLSPAQMLEIERRIALLDADPSRVVPWEVVRDAARARSRARWGK